jgi:hypothetical protein
VHFFQRKLKFLGHVISEEGIAVDMEKVKAIDQMDKPANLKELRSFLGSTNFYRRFIENYASIAKPLTDLLKESNPFVWNTECEVAFKKLKSCLMLPPVLAPVDFSKPFVVHTDASDSTVGAVLMQQYDKGLRPLEYYSRKLSEGEVRYPTHDKELLAILHALKAWRHYLLGVEFDLYTDCGALSVLGKPRSELNRRQIRSIETIEEYSGMTMHHIAGKKNVVADALTRVPMKECFCVTTMENSTNAGESVWQEEMFAPIISLVLEFMKTDDFALQVLKCLEDPEKHQLPPGYDREDFTI